MRDYQQEFIENLKLQRNLKGLSQARLAEFCNVATGTIGNIECGLAKPSFDLILRMAEIFKVHPATLFLSESGLKKIAQESAVSSDRAFLLKLKNEIDAYL